MKNSNDPYFLVPSSTIEQILDAQSKILNLLSGSSSIAGKAPLGDYISESEAKILLNKKTTWFWKMRTSGFLHSAKFGGKNYYRKPEIIKLLDAAFTGNVK